MNRKELLMAIDSFIQLHYGSYNEILEWSVKDMLEINIALESKSQEQKLAELSLF